jgi:hypothetical protein
VRQADVDSAYLFDDSMLLQLLPAGLEPPGFQILNCSFEYPHLLSMAKDLGVLLKYFNDNTSHVI